MYKTGQDCKIPGVYRYSGHPDNSKGCHPIWLEKDVTLVPGKKFPPVGKCTKPAQWVFVRP